VKRQTASLKGRLGSIGTGGGVGGKEALNCNGFSHLEWSASVPYNLAEEPDEVRGMKHSHSCQSMPSDAAPTVTKLSPTSKLENCLETGAKLAQIEEMR
jgi:hypothetical protein